jgi:ribonucleoside-diphosphate reductase alpha chain
MIAAIQPFVSGGISKSVNMPMDSTIDDVNRAFRMAHDLGVKVIALYRDGSKLSQPLVAWTGEASLETVGTFPDPKTPVVVRYLTERRHLPTQRRGYAQKVEVGGHKLFLHTGEYEDGTLGEIFIDMHKEGTTLRAMFNMFAIAISVGLQHGVPLEKFVDLFIHQIFEPNGMVKGDPHIQMSESIVDYLFRHLGVHYLGRTDLAHIQDPTTSSVDPVWDREETEETARRTLGVISSLTAGRSLTDEHSGETGEKLNLAHPSETRVHTGYTGDLCPSCSRPTMVRNGSCLKCAACGATTGCS